MRRVVAVPEARAFGLGGTRRLDADGSDEVHRTRTRPPRREGGRHQPAASGRMPGTPGPGAGYGRRRPGHGVAQPPRRRRAVDGGAGPLGDHDRPARAAGRGRRAPLGAGRAHALDPRRSARQVALPAVADGATELATTTVDRDGDPRARDRPGAGHRQRRCRPCSEAPAARRTLPCCPSPSPSSVCPGSARSPSRRSSPARAGPPQVQIDDAALGLPAQGPRGRARRPRPRRPAVYPATGTWPPRSGVPPPVPSTSPPASTSCAPRRPRRRVRGGSAGARLRSGRCPPGPRSPGPRTSLPDPASDAAGGHGRGAGRRPSPPAGRRGRRAVRAGARREPE